MRLPISFEEVSYFKNAYRGDFIITAGVFYYFPHTNVEQDRYSELAGKEAVGTAGNLLGFIIPIFSASAFGFAIVEGSWKILKFMKRTFRPTINCPKIREKHLWIGNETNEALQKRLDDFIEERKKDSPEITELSLPRPMRFPVETVKNMRVGLKLKFDTEFDDHDFRANIFHHSQLKTALREGGFV